MPNTQPTLYLAGPEVFRPNAIEYARTPARPVASNMASLASILWIII